jgi:release factor glutamine methyltransferase
MPTVLEILSQAERLLAKHTVDSPRLSAQILLAKALGVSRLDLMLDPSRSVPPGACRAFNDLLERRATHEPVAYLVGSKEFYGLDFQVDSRVLIPRPETEELVDHVCREFATTDSLTFADLGTGSGILAVTLAHLFPRARCVAVDIESGALELARSNGCIHGVAGRLLMVQADFLTPFTASCLDLVVSNPPYVTEREYAELSPDVAGFEPQRALVGGRDGLDCLRSIEIEARRVLKPGGVLWAEIGWMQGEPAEKLFANWSACQIVKDLGERDRFVHARL